MYDIAKNNGDPVEYNQDHIYTTRIIGTGKPLKLWIYDPGPYGDNHGSIKVNVFVGSQNGTNPQYGTKQGPEQPCDRLVLDLNEGDNSVVIANVVDACEHNPLLGALLEIRIFHTYDAQLKKAINGDYVDREPMQTDGNGEAIIPVFGKIGDIYRVDVYASKEGWDTSDRSIHVTIGSPQLGVPAGKQEASIKNFAFKPWGAYRLMYISKKAYFAGYVDEPTQEMVDAGVSGAPCLWEKSSEKDLLAEGLISKVLIDDDENGIKKKGGTLSRTSSLKLLEDYQLVIKSIDVEMNRVYLELTRDGQYVDSGTVSAAVDAPIDESTYCYRADLGSARGIVQIAVHFKNAFRGSEENMVNYDGLFQISGSPVPP